MRRSNRAQGPALLIDEPPLQVLPTLASTIGLNEAIVLQQLHFRGRVEPGGWVCKSLEEWRRKDFPFWHRATIQRVFSALHGRGLIGKEQGRATDRTNRIRVDYAALRRLHPGMPRSFEEASQVATFDHRRPQRRSESKRDGGSPQAEALSKEVKKRGDEEGSTQSKMTPLGRRPASGSTEREPSPYDEVMRR